MNYRSNLIAPDLLPHFKHAVSRQMPHSMGHDVISDWADKADDDPVFGEFKQCGFWTHDEAAILYNIARLLPFGDWVDIGCHTGWTTRHIAAAHPRKPLKRGGFNSETCNYVHYIDPALPVIGDRFLNNAGDGPLWAGSPYPMTSEQFFCCGGTHFLYHREPYIGVVIDGDHKSPVPLEDAKGAARCLARKGAILLHDAIGKPVQDAVIWLTQNGFSAKIYSTPHVVACCWRGEFTPPEHVPDPEVVRQLKGRLGEIERWAT